MKFRKQFQFLISQRGVKHCQNTITGETYAVYSYASLFLGTGGPVGTNPVNYLYSACLLQECPMFIF